MHTYEFLHEFLCISSNIFFSFNLLEYLSYNKQQKRTFHNEWLQFSTFVSWDVRPQFQNLNLGETVNAFLRHFSNLLFQNQSANF